MEYSWDTVRFEEGGLLDADIDIAMPICTNLPIAYDLAYLGRTSISESIAADK